VPPRVDVWLGISTVSGRRTGHSTKWFADGDVHKYFSPYETPYDAFVTFMNVLQDLEQRVAPVECT